ncbi:ABC transporter substrate-binding protein [Paracoccus chinensis]|uniref:NitT/TauT family transport system substrate-binding protein n=1 Tax=Paracoccus chinensis TaxID=525640 RepID=A0A1G9LJK2_9RHOB|nr:ABC transporter substrate-binding protein [Paracoccus chinensis]SDL62129.1 NitT/TauT family transport system substrate-binding protein [Paracoccus chinensis]
MLLRGFALTAAIALTGSAALAEMAEITIARQPSLGHLPLMIMEDRGLLEARAAELGVEGLKVNYATLAGGAAMNDALLSGSVQFAAGGVPPLLVLRERTDGTSSEVKGVSAMNSMPLLLNSNKAEIRSIADFTSADKIALPAVKVSIQAILLQMAAEKEFGEGQHDRLDPFTITMSHPDGMAALMAKQEVTAHFTASPIQDLELQNEGVHTVLNSYDILGGPATFNVVWASARFREENPLIYQAFVETLEEAIGVINSDTEAAVDTYVRLSGDASTPELVRQIITDPQVSYTTTPNNIGKYLDFMTRIGTLKLEGATWQDVFFENVHDKQGS